MRKEEWKSAQDDLGAKKNSAAVTVADWMRNEPNWYPNFAPKRDVTEFLRRKKIDYVGAANAANAANGDAANVAKVADDEKSALDPSADAAPQATPEPAAPTRVHTSKICRANDFPKRARAIWTPTKSGKCPMKTCATPSTRCSRATA